MVVSPSATQAIIARPFGQPHQAIVSYRDQHLIVGSGQLNGTMGDRTRPTDMLLAALATDCIFACQDAAMIADMSLYSMAVTAQWRAESADGQIDMSQGIRLRIAMSGPDAEQKTELTQAIMSRSATYRLLAQAIPVVIEIGG
ncbi:MAG: OsmC family protein [Chloroflexota bacterium]|nr:OsmC family protein [Chloroflexota bacterium]